MSSEHPLRVASELARTGKVVEAIACLEAALARTRSSKDRPANTSLLARTAGLFCEDAGRESQAAVYYEEAAATAKDEPLLLLALASVRWRLGQTESARSCLARAEAMAQFSTDAEVLKMVANIRAAWARHDL